MTDPGDGAGQPNGGQPEAQPAAANGGRPETPSAMQRAGDRWGQHGPGRRRGAQDRGNQYRGNQHRGGRDRGEQMVVPKAEFDSYYGRPILKAPVWRSPDVPGYLFLGGLAGASSVLAGFSQLTGNHELSRAAKVTATGAISLSAVALVHDLGRPERFVNMLRVFKVSSPMSVGSWLLASYGPAAGVAGACAVTGWLPRIGDSGHYRRGRAGPGHRVLHRRAARRHLGTCLARGPPGAPVRIRRLGGVRRGRPGHAGRAHGPGRARGPARRAGRRGRVDRQEPAAAPSGRRGRAVPVRPGRAPDGNRRGTHRGRAGWRGAAPAGARLATAVSGAALVAASALTRFGVFEAGMTSARDPKYTVGPQRARLRQRLAAARHPIVPGASFITAVSEDSPAT